MGTSIDNRVVAMKFDNQQFEKGVKTTMNSLGELNRGLQLEGVGKGIDTIASKFTAFHVAGFTAIQEITKGLINLGKKTANAILAPIVAGGKKRSLAIEQAKFQFKGLGMDVEATMQSALEAVKGTAFGLDEAATAAAMFGATGLRAGEEMTKALRGISGIAAMAGSGYSDIADVFTKVAGQGRLMGDDLNRLASRGINAAATLGKALGKSEADVRKMVSKGEIDFKLFAKVMDDTFGEHATKASETFTGSLSNFKAAFSRIGARHYTNQFEALRISINALTPVIDAVGAAIGPVTDLIGKRMLKSADILSTWLGSLNFKNAENLLTPLVRGLEHLFSVSDRIMAPLVRVFRNVFPPKTAKDVLLFAFAFEKLAKKLDPSALTIRKITAAFKDVLIVFKTVGQTIKGAFSYLTSIVDFGIVFRGLFAIFSLAGQSIRFVIEALYSLFDALFLTTGIGDGFAKALGKGIEGFFQFFINLEASADKTKFFGRKLETLKGIFEGISTPIKTAAEWMKGLVSSFIEFLGPLDPISEGFRNTGTAADFFSKVIEALAVVIGTVLKVLDPLIQIFKDALDGVTLDDILKTLLTATSIGFLGSINGFLVKFFELFRGWVPNFRFFFNELAFSLKSFSASMTASAIKQIAISILILAVAMLILSNIDAEAAKRGAGGIGVILMMLGGFMQANKAIGSVQGLHSTAVALTVLGVALIVLAGAVKKLGELEPDVLQQGLISIAALLGGLAIFKKLVSTDKGMVSTGIGFIMFAVALRILAGVLGVIGEMDEVKLKTSMTTLGIIFAAIAAFTRVVDPSKFIVMGVGMVLLAANMKIMASALKSFSGLSWEEIGRGLVGMAGGLILMVGAMKLMPKGGITKATGLLIMSGAIYILGVALEKIGGMDWSALSRGLVGIGVSLALILAFLLLAGSPSIFIGAAALMIVSGALLILAGVLKTIGAMSVESIATALGAIALAFVIVAAAGYALTGALPGLLGLGLALLMIGGAVFLASVGVGLFAAGIVALGLALATGGKLIIAFIVELANELPGIAKSIATAIGAFAEGLFEQQEKITKAFVAMTSAILDGMIAVVPKMAELASILMDTFLDLVVEKTPGIVQAMLDMLIAVLEAIRDNIPKIVKLSGDIAVAYIDGLADYYNRIATAGANFIIKVIEGIGRESKRIIDAALETVLTFITGLTDSIRQNGRKITNAAVDLINEFAYQLGYAASSISFWSVGKNIVDGIISGIKNNTKSLPGPIKTVVNKALGMFNHAARADSPAKLFIPVGEYWVLGIAEGLKQSTDSLNKASKNVVNSAYLAMKDAGSQTLDVFGDLEDPTITPVVNLDSVYEGAKAISALMSDASSIDVSGAVDSRMSKTGTDASTTTNTGNTVEATLIQNNYSPKALSRLEIYRQTKNQLQLLKGLGG